MTVADHLLGLVRVHMLCLDICVVAIEPLKKQQQKKKINTGVLPYISHVATMHRGECVVTVGLCL